MLTQEEIERLEYCLAQETTSVEEAIEFLEKRFPDCTVERTEHVIDRVYHSTRTKRPMGNPTLIINLPSEFKHTGSHRPHEGKSLTKYIQLWAMPPGESVTYRYSE